MAVNKKKGGSWGVSAVIGAVLLFAFLAWVAPAVSTHGGTTAASSQTSSTATASQPTATTPAADPAANPAATGNVPTSRPDSIPATPPTPLTVAAAQAELNLLPVAAPVTDGYNRDNFKLWTDANGDGCNTRAEVLKAESSTPTSSKVGSKCTIVLGSWLSSYDNVQYTDGTKLDIDHSVPLSEAWQSGANTWTAAQREAYANDLGYPGSLIAVSATTNRAKGDQDPSTWMPPYAGVRCTYVANWIAVKWRWQLAVDQAEKNALNTQLSTCTDSEIVTPTR